jgi:hypothetical protein
MKKFINKLEKVTGIDIDGDGKIGDKVLPGHSSQHAYGFGNNMPSGGGYAQPGYIHQQHPHAQLSAQNAPHHAAQHAPHHQPVPPGWEKKVDPSSGRPFYVNHSTKTTQWEPPTGAGVIPAAYVAQAAAIPVAAAAAPHGAPPAGNLPPGWEMKVDPATGDPFYINHKTKVTQWQHPGMVANHNQQQQLVLASQIWQPQNYTNTHVQNYHVNTGYFDAPTMPESTNIPSSGRRKALLIGINYFGTANELRGCINDVHNMVNLLLSEGFNRYNK